MAPKQTPTTAKAAKSKARKPRAGKTATKTKTISTTPKESIREALTTVTDSRNARQAKPEINYSRELAAEILTRLADGEPLKQICRDDHMPSSTAVRLWAIDDTDGFASRYARARDALLEVWADEIVDISDDSSNDWIERETEKGRIIRVIDQEHIARSRLRTENRKWLLSKLKPRTYGDKLEVDTPQDSGFAKAAAITSAALAALVDRK